MFKKQGTAWCFVQNISTWLFDTFPPTSLKCFIWLSLIVFMFMSPDLSSDTVFSLNLDHKAFEEHYNNYWTIGILSLKKKKKAKTHTCNILITRFFEVLYLTEFNKILCSRAVFLVKKWGFRFSRPGRCLIFCISNKLSCQCFGLGATLWVARFQRFLNFLWTLESPEDI